MKKFLLLISMLLFAVMSLWATSTTRYVNPDGLCGGSTPCYTTIQAAINAAVDGDIIQVAVGTYTEDINVPPAKQLTIKGANVGVPACGGTRSTESIIIGGFIVYSNATVIDGFHIKNGGTYGGHKNGISVGGSSGTVGDPDDIVIQNNIIENCNSTGADCGIETVPHCDRLQIKGNDIRNNRIGIYLNPSDGILVDGNCIHDNNGSGVGIGSDGQSNFTITHNYLYNQVEGLGSSAVGANVVLHNNSILTTINHYGGSAVDATCNWWGATSGPTTGQTSGSVNSLPWLAVGTDTGDPGFVPASGTCIGGPVTVWRSGAFVSAHATIQAGIGAAISGDEVRVAAGTYNESVSVDKGLKLYGPNYNISPVTGTRLPEAIITVNSRIGTTDPVEIKGFKFTYPGTSNTIDQYASGTVVLEKNYFDDVTGLFFANPASFSIVDNLCIFNSNSGEGIFIAGNYNGTTGTYADIHDNKFIDGPITGFNLSSVHGIIYNNTFDNIPYYGVLIANTCSLEIYQNTFKNITNPNPAGSATWGAGIRFYQGFESGLTANIHDNSFTNNYNGISARPAADFTGSNINVSIHNNVISGNTNYNVLNQGTGALNATCNWFGTAVAADIAAKINGAVTYIPYSISNGGACIGGLPVQVVRAGIIISGHSTIQAGIDAAQNGDEVNVSAGTYIENVLLNKSVILQGSGPLNTILTPSASCSGTGVSISSANAKLKDLKVTNYTYGVAVSNTGIEINNVEMVSNCQGGLELSAGTGNLTVLNSKMNNNTVMGFRKGTAPSISGFTMDNCEVKSNLAQGCFIATTTGTGVGTFDNISITNSDFSNNLQKGMYFEALSNAVIDNIAMNNSGTDASYGFNNGIDINLKYHDYSNITIKNSEITNCGSTGISTAPDNPAAVAIKARDDAPSYNANPATLTNVTIENNIISGPNNGLRFGEFGKTNAGPASVNVYHNDLGSAFLNKALVNCSSALVSATCDWWGSTGPAVIETKIKGAVTWSPFLVSDNLVTPLCTGQAPVYNATKNIYYGTLQAAMDAAATGDDVRILVAGASGGVVFNKPGMSVTLTNTSSGTVTLQGASPALTVTAGTLNITGFSLTTATNDPTILVNGGTLIMRSCTVTESTGFTNTGISVTSGVLDAGTDCATNAGNNTFVSDGGGLSVTQTGGTANAVGNYWGSILYFDVYAEISGTVAFDPWRNAAFSNCYSTAGGPVTWVPKMITPLGAVTIPVKVNSFNNVNSIALNLTFNPALLTLNSSTAHTSLTGMLVGNPLPGIITISWIGSSGVSLADGSTIVDLKFIFTNSGTSKLIWDDDPEGNCEYQNALIDYVYNDDPTATYYTDGWVSNLSVAFTRNYSPQSITAVPTGGTSPYTYVWTGPVSQTATTQTITPTDGSGTYTVKVTDANGVEVTATYFYGPVHNISTGLDYATIQAGVNAATAGNTLLADPGSYYEEVVVNKQLTIRGANYLVNPCTGTPGPASVIFPTTNNADPSSSTATRIVLITANGVVFEGFTIDGDNPSQTGIYNACYGISAESGQANLDIKNNIVQNLPYTGIYLCNDAGGSMSSGNQIRNNKINNLSPDSGYGIGVYTGNNTYADIKDNCMTNVRKGIQGGENNYLANTGNVSPVWSGNTISSYKIGIWNNLAYSNATPVSITGNHITTVSGSTINSGIEISSIAGTCGVSIASNDVTGAMAGINLWSNPTSNTITVSGSNSFINCDYGVFANNWDGYNSDASSSSYIVDGCTITNPGIAAVFVKDNPSNTNGATVAVEVKNISITGSSASVGVLVSGGDASGLVHNCSITGYGTGVRILDGGNLTGCANNFITGCITAGVKLESTAGTIDAINNNKLSGNPAGNAINNQLATQVNAECNWYGFNDYAGVTAQITGNVDYISWLTVGTDNELATAGFQPVPNSCSGMPLTIVSAVPGHILCGDTKGSILVSFGGGTAPYSISWTGASSGSFSPIAVSSYTIPNLTAGSYTITVTDALSSLATYGPVVLQYRPVTNITKDPDAYYATIQAAVDDASNGDVINVCAGTFTENVIVNKEVTINGAGQTNTIVVPAISDPGGDGGPSFSNSQIMVISANNVTISNLTVDGNNPLITSGITRNSVDIDARNGIIESDGPWNNLHVTNVTVRNIYLRGIYARSGGTGFHIDHNTVNNIAGGTSSIAVFNYGGSGIIEYNSVTLANDAISANHSTGTQFLNNIVTNCGSGIHTDNNGDGGGTADIIENNTISNSPANGYGIFIFAPYKNVVVRKNTITNVEVGLTAAGTYASGVLTTFSQNVIDGQMKANSVGIYSTTEIWGYTSGNQNALFTNNVIKNNVQGFFICSQAGFNNTTTANNNSITGNTTGVILGKDYTGGTPDGTLTLDMNCNWWGAITAAAVATAVNASNPPVDYDPWLINGNDNDLITTGFQPVPLSCSGTPVVIASAVPTNQYCSSMGSIAVTFSGGTSPYTIAWTGTASNSATGTSVYNITGLAAGTYTITVTDANGSSATTGTVTILYQPVHNTTQNTHFGSIQAAIDDGTTADGDVIQICAGLYKENVLVTKAVTLEGLSRTGTIIAPLAEDTGDGWSKTAGTPQNGIVVQSNDVTIKTLTIDGTANNLANGGTLPNHFNFRHGIRIADGVDYKNVTVQDCDVKNILRRAVFLYPTTGFTGPYTVTGCNVLNVQYQNAISIGSANSTITGNTLDNVNNAISVHHSVSNPNPAVVTTISNNVITNLGHIRDGETYPPTGIYYRNPNDDRQVTIQNNSITAANNVASPIGFYLYNTNSSSIISGNTVNLATLTSIDPTIPPSGTYGNFAWSYPLGCYLGGSAGATVQNNTFSLYGTGSGIYTGRGSGTIPVPNIITGNTLTATTPSGTGFESYGVASSDDPNFDVIGEDQTNSNNTITNNFINGFRRGILLHDVNTYTVEATIHSNNLSGNTLKAIDASTLSNTVDATCNWYGTAEGTLIQAMISGIGVDFSPWLENGTDIGNPGFVPGATCTGGIVSVVLTSKTDVTCNGGNNGAIDITVSGGIEPYTYIWSDGSVTTQDRSSLVAGTYLVTVTDAILSTGTLSITINEPAAIPISGILTYYNLVNTPLGNVIINLKQSGSVVKTCTTSIVTGSVGQYIFSNVCPGIYDVEFVTTKEVGYINSTDAAQVNSWQVSGTGSEPVVYNSIERVRFNAGDVSGNNRVTSQDANMLQSYYVNYYQPPFDPLWKFWKAGVTVNTNNPLPLTLQLTVPTGSGPIVQNFYGLGNGDFNRSYAPAYGLDPLKSTSGGNSINSSLTLIESESMQIAPNMTVNLPVKAGTGMKVGAISMTMNFPTDKLTVEGVFLQNNPDMPVLHSINNGKLRIGWNSLNPVSLVTGETLLTIRLKTASSLANGEELHFILDGDPLNELADNTFNVIPDAVLKINVLKSTTVGINNPVQSGALSLMSYPNPFNSKVNIEYTLPEDGQVNIEITGITGNKLKLLASERQVAGIHVLEFDGNAFAPGIYLLTLRFEKQNGVNMKTIRIIKQ